MMRHVCDTALDLVLYDDEADSADGWMRPEKRRVERPHSYFWTQNNLSSVMRDRVGDFSVLYAMHYFNNTEKGGSEDDSSDEFLDPAPTSSSKLPPGIAVKAHVDPSVLVLEPFLCQETTGLQVWDRERGDWMDCDGPNSPAASLWEKQLEVMLLFVGKAMTTATESSSSCSSAPIEPTLHRVVTGDRPRRTVIYEQKYEEFYSAPALD